MKQIIINMTENDEGKTSLIVKTTEFTKVISDMGNASDKDVEFLNNLKNITENYGS